jgi:tRNA G10  N-methylase Trm11
MKRESRERALTIERIKMQYQIFNLDCLDVMSLYLEDNLVDAIVTDPPYGLSFMGKDWDHGVPGIDQVVLQVQRHHIQAIQVKNLILHFYSFDS